MSFGGAEGGRQGRGRGGGRGGREARGREGGREAGGEGGIYKLVCVRLVSHLFTEKWAHIANVLRT